MPAPVKSNPSADNEEPRVIELREQFPPPLRFAGAFRVTAEMPTGLLYDRAGLNAVAALAAFDSNIELARRRGYSVGEAIPGWPFRSILSKTKSSGYGFFPSRGSENGSTTCPGKGSSMTTSRIRGTRNNESDVSSIRHSRTSWPTPVPDDAHRTPSSNRRLGGPHCL